MNADKWLTHFTEQVNAGLDGETVSVFVGDTELECLIASTDETRTRGLSQHTELPSDGMIFIYDADHGAKFTRKDMAALSVSIWFFNSDGELVGNGWAGDVAEAREPYRYVIEANIDAKLSGTLRLMELS